MTARRGFTLLEMMVATTIMGVAVVGLLSEISGSVHNAARLRDYDRVAQLAREQMNELLADYQMPRNVEIEQPVRSGHHRRPGSGLARAIDHLRKAGVAGGALALDRIQLEVWWNSGGKRRTSIWNRFASALSRPRISSR